MELYKIMLVDDEEEVRESIIRKVSWEKAGFTVVGSAENGQDALEKAEMLEPDVVITDIRMPYMDGLEMARRLRKQYPSMKFIIFSGFDAFEYAKQAIQLNVTEYILKPVNVEELTEILERIKLNLDQEIAEKRDVDSLRQTFFHNLPFLQERFCMDLLKGRVKTEHMEELMREYQIDLCGSEVFMAGVIEIGMETVSGGLTIHQEHELIPISVQQIAAETLLSDFWVVTMHEQGILNMIVGMSKDRAVTELIDGCNEICRSCKKILKLDITIGLGDRTEQLSGLRQSYRQAREAVGYKNIMGNGRVIYIKDVEPMQRVVLHFDSKSEQELMAAIKFGVPEQIEQTVRRIALKMDEAKVHVRQYQMYLIGIMNCLTQMIQRYELSPIEIFGNDQDYFEILRNLNTTENVQQWLAQICLRMSEQIRFERATTTRNMIQEAKEYIREHYANPDLSVEMLCGHLHISPAYFSTMFKRETGKTYVAYLTDVRMERAVELLNHTEEKTYMIAAAVGYTEPNYFSYVFKKQFGMSPTKYRGNGNHGAQGTHSETDTEKNQNDL